MLFKEKNEEEFTIEIKLPEQKSYTLDMFYTPGRIYGIEDRLIITGNEEAVELLKANFVSVDKYNELKEKYDDLSDRICKIDKIIKED